jgi:spore coat protein U-like protein
MKTMFRLALAAALALVGAQALAAPGPGSPATQSFQVTANTQTSCRFVATNTLGFGTYDPTSAADVPGSTTYTFKCSKNTGYTVTIDHGQNNGSGAVAAQPSMVSTPAGDFLSYYLCADAACSTKYTNGATIFSGTAGSNANLPAQTIYGIIPNGQNVGANETFLDNVTLSINY